MRQIVRKLREATRSGLVDVDRYVDDVGMRLAEKMSGVKQWSFSTIRNRTGGSTYEPLSLPGGFVFESALLIVATNNEAEFAGMLAHAMAHVAARHYIHTERADVGQLGTIPLIFMGGPAGLTSDDEHIGMPLAFANTHRLYELEADRIAVATAAAAGYYPNGLLNYVGRMQPPIPRQSEAFAALPPLATRQSNLATSVRKLKVPGSCTSVGPFDSIRSEVLREQTRLSYT